MRKLDPRALAVLTLVLTVLYSLLTHVLTVEDDRTDGGYLAAFASIWLILAGAAMASARRGPLLLLATLAVIGFGWLYKTQAWDPRWIYLAQHAGTFGALALAFGLSLREDTMPLVTRMASAVHGELSPAMADYTRQVTLAWALFSALLCLSSLLLFLGGWMWAWSVLANLLSLPLVALMFVAEYTVRHRRFPDFEHASLADSVRAFRRLQPSEPPEPPAR